jgi:plastocyanin
MRFGLRGGALVLAAVCALDAGGAAPAPPAGTAHTVVMEGVAFAPAALTVRAGETVTWVNKDAFPHTATSQDRSFDSGEIAAARNWKMVARKRGTFEYVCTLHPGMKGTLVVK